MSGVRYQQVYDASQFSVISEGGGFINAIAFRPSQSSTLGATADASDLQINLSTTAHGPDGLSSQFAQNVGPDDAIVFGPGPISLEGFFSTGSSPQAFEMLISFANPFYYDPRAGNLLMDIRNYSGGHTFGSMSGEFAVGDPVSRVLGRIDSPSADILSDSFGLVTAFSVTPVPEPSSWFLLLAGGLPLGFWLGRGRLRKGARR